MEVKQLKADKSLGSAEIDVSVLGDKVKKRLLFDAVHMYESRRRVGTASTKTRSEVAGSGAKPWRQKGTGRARCGTKKSPIWRGGGVTHGPKPRDYGYALPRKALKEATRSALLSKFRDDEVRLIEDLQFEKPSTPRMVELLRAAGVNGACLVVTATRDPHVFLSCRNIPYVACLPIEDLNAYDVLKHRHMMLSTETCAKLLEQF